MEYEKTESVVFVYVYALGVEEPIFRQVYDDYDEAVKTIQKLASDGVGSFDYSVQRNVYYPAHRIDRFEYFRAKRLTLRTEKDSSQEDVWHGHYEDLEGNEIVY